MHTQAKFIFLSLFFISTPSLAQSVAVDVTLVPAGSFKAETKKITGKAFKSPQGVMAENITVDLKSLTTGVSLRDKHLKDHLMVSKYPQAKLIKAIGRSGKGKATIEVKGKKQTVNGTYKINGSMLDAEFKMILSELDIKDIKYMGVGVSDEVVLHISIPISESKGQ